MGLPDTLQRIIAGQDLDQAEARALLDEILDGTASPVQVAGLLIALRMKGETSAELAGFAQSMRSHSERVTVQPDGKPLLDTCGTGGGEGIATFNISTVAAFVAAGAGVRVAKHGNRAISSRCGSADLLDELGARTTLTGREAAQAIEQVGIGFLFAPAFHPAMRQVQPVRRELGVRTVFNLLGPLTNPAGAGAQLVGAPSIPLARKMAEALVYLSLERGFVVHGAGLDEVTTTGDTTAFQLSPGGVDELKLTPEDFGFQRARVEDLAGGDAPCNAAIARAVLAGKPGAARDIVIVNAATALVAVGRADGWLEAARIAQDSLDSGSAARTLRNYIDFTRQTTPE